MDARHRLTLAYLQAHPVEAARGLEALSADDAASLLGAFEPTAVADVVECLLPDVGAEVLQRLPRDIGGGLLSHVASPAAIALLRHCPPGVRAELVEELDPEVRQTIHRSLSYPDRTAGSLADPRILTLAANLTVAEALTRVTRAHRRATYYLYVLDRSAKLVGVVSLKELLAADPGDSIGTVMSTHIASVSAASTVEELRAHSSWRVFHTLPVLDRGGAFLGALRYRTLRALEEEEAAPAERPGFLSGALVALWEAYALAGIRIMTDLASTMPPAAEKPPPSRGPGRRP